MAGGHLTTQQSMGNARPQMVQEDFWGLNVCCTICPCLDRTRCRTPNAATACSVPDMTVACHSPTRLRLPIPHTQL